MEDTGLKGGKQFFVNYPKQSERHMFTHSNQGSIKSYYKP